MNLCLNGENKTVEDVTTVAELLSALDLDRRQVVVEVNEKYDAQKGFAPYLDLDPRCREWEDMMDRFQEALPEAGPGYKWAEMENICRIA